MTDATEADHKTAQKIYDWYESKREEHREHLGASLIGHECDRFLWLTFRWAASPKFGGRVLRLFGTGKREEQRVYEELRAIGVELHVDQDGKQIECRDSRGHFGGSVDGIGRGFPEGPETWAVLEIKTANFSASKKLKDAGVEKAKPQHYAQMMIYMGMLKLDRALYLNVNKNTDDIYTEWVPFHEGTFNDLMRRAGRIIGATEPGPKVADSASKMPCKFCDFAPFCHDTQTAEFNCRTCCHSTPRDGGKWQCHEHDKELSVEDQRKGCDSHLFIPALVHGTPVDGGVNFVEYFVESTGETFKNGPAHTTSREVTKRGRKKKAVVDLGPEISLDDLNDDIPF